MLYIFFTISDAFSYRSTNRQAMLNLPITVFNDVVAGVERNLRFPLCEWGRDVHCLGHTAKKKESFVELNNGSVIRIFGVHWRQKIYNSDSQTWRGRHFDRYLTFKKKVPFY